jgi:hypothetical protein
MDALYHPIVAGLWEGERCWRLKSATIQALKDISLQAENAVQLACLRFSPRAQIHRIQGNAENVRRDEAELRCAESDHAHDCAVDACQNPTLPAAPS